MTAAEQLAPRTESRPHSTLELVRYDITTRSPEYDHDIQAPESNADHSIPQVRISTS